MQRAPMAPIPDAPVTPRFDQARCSYVLMVPRTEPSDESTACRYPSDYIQVTFSDYGSFYDYFKTMVMAKSSAIAMKCIMLDRSLGREVSAPIWQLMNLVELETARAKEPPAALPTPDARAASPPA